jgi:hypothetical protein
MKTSDTAPRVLAFRLDPKAFDALTVACQGEGLTKTDMVLEGLALALAKHGKKGAAKRFKSTRPPAS